MSFLSFDDHSKPGRFRIILQEFRKLLQRSTLFSELTTYDTIQVIFGILLCFVETWIVSVLIQQDTMFDQSTAIHHGVFHRSRSLVKPSMATPLGNRNVKVTRQCDRPFRELATMTHRRQEIFSDNKTQSAGRTTPKEKMVASDLFQRIVAEKLVPKWLLSFHPHVIQSSKNDYTFAHVSKERVSNVSVASLILKYKTLRRDDSCLELVTAFSSRPYKRSTTFCLSTSSEAEQTQRHLRHKCVTLN